MSASQIWKNIAIFGLFSARRGPGLCLVWPDPARRIAARESKGLVYALKRPNAPHWFRKG